MEICSKSCQKAITGAQSFEMSDIQQNNHFCTTIRSLCGKELKQLLKTTLQGVQTGDCWLENCQSCCLPAASLPRVVKKKAWMLLEVLS